MPNRFPDSTAAWPRPGKRDRHWVVIRASIVSALALGLIEASAQYLLGVRWSFALLLLIVIAVLVWRPFGLFGRRQVVRL